MKTDNLKYPLYRAVIDDIQDGIYTMSLVDSPAVHSNWLAFKEEKEMQSFKIEDEEQRIVTGCFLRADYPILRRKNDDEYYYLLFEKDTIKLMVMKWLGENRINFLNEMHDKSKSVEDVFLQEVFIKDTNKGISPKGFENVEEGSAFCSYKVCNDELWEQIKDGTFTGFSIEALLGLKKMEMAEEQEEKDLNEIMKIIKEILKK